MTEYVIAVSNDGVNFTFVTPLGHLSDDVSIAMKFVGNSGEDTVSTGILPRMFETRFIRLFPVAYNNHASLRWDILECIDPKGKTTIH